MPHIAKLIPTNCYTRYSCALGGFTDKESIICEVADGPYTGFRVAPSFLKSYTDLDAELEREAVALEAEAAHILANAKKMRELKGGNLILPTYDEFLEATRKAES